MSGHCVLIKGLGPKTIDVHNCSRFTVLNKKYKRGRKRERDGARGPEGGEGEREG